MIWPREILLNGSASYVLLAQWLSPKQLADEIVGDVHFIPAGSPSPANTSAAEPDVAENFECLPQKDVVIPKRTAAEQCDREEPFQHASEWSVVLHGRTAAYRSDVT